MKRSHAGVFLVLVIFTFVFFQKNAFAHGTYGYLMETEGWMIQAFYDDDEPMSDSEASVYAGNGKTPVQTGRTDSKGRFLFYPDRAEVWKVVVEDEMGHAVILEKEIKSIDENISENNRTSLPERPDKTGGVLAGIGIISLIFSVFFWLSAKKTREKKEA